MINGKTKIYGIIGNPVSHSLSPIMHNRAFNILGINSAYIPFNVTDVENCMRGLKALNVYGASVTLPHKQAVIEYLDEIDPVAEKIGAVNTLQVTRNDENVFVKGSNTDWVGANMALLAKTALKGKKAIILGAGGSARAIGFGLQEEGVQVELCSRTRKSGEALAQILGCDWYGLDKVESLEGDILINATSVGMGNLQGQSLVSADGLKDFEVVMDIVYAPHETQLLKNAKEAGCDVVYGLDMLLFQGVAQFELWTGQTAPVEEMRKILLQGTGS